MYISTAKIRNWLDVGYTFSFSRFLLFLSLSTSWINQRHLKDPLTCPRDETVQELARILDENVVVNVRGTPAPGKSVLTQLLRDHCHSKDAPVILFRTWHRDQTEDHTNGFVRKASRRLWFHQFSHARKCWDGHYSWSTNVSYGRWPLVWTYQGSNRFLFGSTDCHSSSYGSPTGGPLQP